MGLKDKVVFISGSSDGIGAQAALAFAKEGANVVITYTKQRAKAEAVYDECNKLSPCLLLHLDVRDDISIKRCVEETIDEFGDIDILVNNAGVVVWKDLKAQSALEIDEQIDVNLNGLIKLTKEVLPYFQAKNEGIVLNIASGAGKEGYGEISVYCATKFGVRGFTQAMAEEYDKHRIKFFSINPGTTKTKMTNYVGVEPKDVAAVIVNAAKEELGKHSGEDVDVWDYV